MFQLIVTVLAIALVATLSVATLWFGGVAFTSGGDQVEYTKIRNGAFQIEAALNMYFGDRGVYPEGTSDDILNALVDGNYLTSIPLGGRGPDGELTYRIESNQIVRSLVDVEQCYKINKLAGVTTEDECPPCSDPEYASYMACDRDAAPSGG